MALPQTKVRVFAFSQGTGLPVPGIAATITAKWARDYGASNPLADTNPTEAEDGYYYFDLSINERNLTTIGEIFPKSSTSGIRVIGVPSFVTPKPWIEVPAKVRVFAYNVLTGEPEVGGQLKITAKWAKDYESAQPLTDINPVEVEGEEGYYYFDLTNDERDVEIIGEIFAESETNNVHVVGLPEFFILDPTSNRARERRDVPIVRSINDNLPISFLWPTADATFVVRRSINDAVFEAASGTVGTALRQEGSRWRYQLSYNAADRPAAEGKAQYELTAGGRTRFVELRVEGSGGGGAILTGPNAITVTVTDSDTSDAIEAATIRFYRTGETGTQATNDAGQTVFGLATATWSWIASAAGYSSKTGSLVVSANGTLAIELDGIVSVVAEAPYCNVTLPTIDLTGTPRPDTLVTMKFIKYLAGSTRTAVVVKENLSETSNGSGIASFQLLRLARYEASYKVLRNETKVVEFDTPNSGAYTVVEPLS
jgi:hypothetical protein